MGFTRQQVRSGGIVTDARAGDSLTNPVITSIATDAAATITAAQIEGGVVQFTGFTAGRVLTTDTAANILAAFPEMDVGDSVEFRVSCVAAFAGTYAAGTGVTLAGRATTPASSHSVIYITKTSATTVTWTVL
jgi:hypothetical protein